MRGALRHGDAITLPPTLPRLSRQASAETARHLRGLERDLCPVSSAAFGSIIGRGQQFLALAFTNYDSQKTVNYSK